MNTLKTSFTFTAFALVAALMTGCATTSDSRWQAFQPKPALAPSKADAFAGYGEAMSSQRGYQMAYEWQRKNPKAVEEATSCPVILGFVASDAAADALLAKIGTSYDGDPLVLTQIAAVTQRVMCPKDPNAPALRKRWVAALERRIETTDDGYVRTFCHQQLRLCK